MGGGEKQPCVTLKMSQSRDPANSAKLGWFVPNGNGEFLGC